MPPKKLGKQYLWKSPMGGMVNKRKQEAHESFGKLNYSRLVLFTFTRGGSFNPVHLQIKNTISISNKNEGHPRYGNLELFTVEIDHCNVTTGYIR